MRDLDMAPVTKIIELSNGIRLPFLEQGDASGIPVVFLHGFTDSMHSFAPVLPYLPPAIHAFAPTQRGHGDADRPACGYRTRDFASDVALFLDALGVQRAFIVGHSMGATNAQRFALDQPARTAGLVLAGSFASYKAHAGLVEFWESSVSQLRDPIDAAFARAFQTSTLAGPIAPQFFELVMRECLKVPASVWRQAFAGFLEDDFSQELEAIAAPALLVWGERDTLSPRRDQEIALSAIRNAALVVYEGTGHAVHWEQPRRFGSDVVAFINAHAERLNLQPALP